MKKHVFVVDGDLTQVACDAWLLPVDDVFDVSPSWASAGRGITTGRIPGQPGWAAGERVRLWLPSGPGEGRIRRPQVWLGRIGTYGRDSEWYVDGVRAFIAAAAAALDTNDSRSIPLLAINLVGTGYGGLSENKGELLTDLFEALQDAVDEVDCVDVAVVCWGSRPYAAAQRARLNALSGGVGPTELLAAAETWGFEYRRDELLTVARRLADHARADELALFVGAGASVGAGLQSWAGLLLDLAASLKQTGPDISGLHDPRDQAALLERRFAAEGLDLHAQVAHLLKHEHYSLAHGLLASLPCGEVVTTNFDLMFEHASRTANRRLSVLPEVPDPEARRWLLKLHGSLNEPGSMVFTRASYVEAPRRRGALFGLVQAMLLTRHMLFVGYSLSDEDFHEVVHDVQVALPESAREFATAITLFDDPPRRELWAGSIDVVAMRPSSTDGETDQLAAARDVELFLDLVGFLASNRAAFLLDPTYSRMLSDSEQQLVGMLAPLVEHHETHRGESGWDAVSQMIERLGGLPDDS